MSESCHIHERVIFHVCYVSSDTRLTHTIFLDSHTIFTWVVLGIWVSLSHTWVSGISRMLRIEWYASHTYNISTLTYNVSRLTYNISRLTYNIYRLTYNISSLTYNVSRLTLHIDWYTSHTYNIFRLTYNIAAHTNKISRFTLYIDCHTHTIFLVSHTIFQDSHTIFLDSRYISIVHVTHIQHFYSHIQYF